MLNNNPMGKFETFIGTKKDGKEYLVIYNPNTDEYAEQEIKKDLGNGMFELA